MNTEHLYGIYELISIESYVSGVKTDEIAKSGLLTLTQNHKISVVCASSQSLMSYAGTFYFKDDHLEIEIHACNYTEMVSKSILRKIVNLTEDHLIMDASGSSDSGRSVMITSKRISD